MSGSVTISDSDYSKFANRTKWIIRINQYWTKLIRYIFAVYLAVFILSILWSESAGNMLLTFWKEIKCTFNLLGTELPIAIGLLAFPLAFTSMLVEDDDKHLIDTFKKAEEKNTGWDWDTLEAYDFVQQLQHGKIFCAIVLAYLIPTFFIRRNEFSFILFSVLVYFSICDYILGNFKGAIKNRLKARLSAKKLEYGVDLGKCSIM